MTLTNRELDTLRAVCDTIVPKVNVAHVGSDQTKAFYERSATELGVDKALAEIIETRIEPALRDQFLRLLSIVDSRMYNLILTGRPTKFGASTLEERTRYLQSWRDSPLGSKRQAFQALKRLVCFLFYTLTDNKGSNPNWSEIGYPAARIETRLGHPQNLKITPIVPEKDQTLECDVCVVGSGAGGSVAAFELSKRGNNVLVVEVGPYATADSFDQGELTMMNKLFDDYGTAATRDLSFVLLSGRGAGGGTTVNWMTCIKPPPAVLKNWEEEFGIADLTGKEFNSTVEEVWKLLKVNLDESQLNFNNEALLKGCQALGYHEGQDFERIWRNAVDCRQRCAYCTYGCVYSCKQSTILNYLPMAFKNGARFLFDTKVDRIVVEEGAAKGVEARTFRNGKSFNISIRAKVVVLSCGSIKTPVLIQNSGIRGKNIGKNLRLHPTTAVSGIFEEEVRAWDGPPQTVVVTKHLDLDGSKHGFWMEAAPAHPGLFALSSPWPDGKRHKDFMRERFNHSTASIVLLKEWSTGSVDVDKHGSAVVKYRLEERDRRSMIRGIKETGRILAAAGASGLSTLHSDLAEVRAPEGKNTLSENDLESFYDIVEKRGIAPNRLMLFSAHIMGSCRMGSDESIAAVSVEGELLGVRNLFIADASVFPTTLGANPMITIMSMSKRTSEFVAIRLDATR
ncbi:MAG TPA: GMC family oxidoreductase N-terminal domain-containing protein [Nitrososphaerales archaeon]|nr:GMC family oxidoreductase N-terminal domain-containing protein [Nitrososphaerales archaeon]